MQGSGHIRGVTLRAATRGEGPGKIAEPRKLKLKRRGRIKGGYENRLVKEFFLKKKTERERLEKLKWGEKRGKLIMNEICLDTYLCWEY